MEEKDKFGRTMHKTKCSECGQETNVPFEPDGQRPVYCRDCFMKKRAHRGQRHGRGFGNQRTQRRNYQNEENNEEEY